ncbi:MAG: TetR/AcrR family transcriptional regulator [Actinomycetales bacterium]|nr:TetR/AcrR family transcriptional regulator [Actinomycetales bacterium]
MTTRREQILTSAASLFAQRGYLGVSVNDIGEACGISGPALYKHFSGKEQLLAESLTSISERLLREGAVRVANAGSAAGALESLIDWHVSFALSEPTLIILQEREWANLTPDAQTAVRTLQRAYIDLWVDSLAEVRSDWDRATARAAAQAVFGLINSTPHSARIDAAGMRALLTGLAHDALFGSTA